MGEVRARYRGTYLELPNYPGLTSSIRWIGGWIGRGMGAQRTAGFDAGMNIFYDEKERGRMVDKLVSTRTNNRTSTRGYE